MTSGDALFRQIQSVAREMSRQTAGPVRTQDLLAKHALEAFLHRLTLTEFADDFVLKGGILSVEYGSRRATRDVDTNSVRSVVSPKHLASVVEAIVALRVEDGVAFDLTSLSFSDIRDNAIYPALRIRVNGFIGKRRVPIVWDVTTGDPIVPQPQRIIIGRLIGEPFEILGYSRETVIAEKAVTILERATTSTRWRDYVDIVELAKNGIDEVKLLNAARATASFRGVTLGPIAPSLANYELVGQEKWRDWRQKQELESICEPNLVDQLALVIAIIDPVFSLGPS